MLFLALKKVRMVKITPRQIYTNQSPPQQNFASSLPLKVISKTLDKWSALATAYFICKHLIEISSVSTGMNDYNNRIWPDSG